MLTGAEAQVTASADQLAPDLLSNHESMNFLDGMVPMLLNFRLPPDAIAGLVIGQTVVGEHPLWPPDGLLRRRPRGGPAQRGRVELGR